MKDVELRNLLIDMKIIEQKSYGIVRNYGYDPDRISSLERWLSGIMAYLDIQIDTGHPIIAVKKKSKKSQEYQCQEK